jgi:hypothetical protein
MLNATYLFEKRSRNFKNSESRWTAIAQISLIYMSKHIVDSKLPVYISDKDGFLDQTGLFDVNGFSCDNTVCEQSLTGTIFGINDFDMKYHRIAPDISHLRDNQKKVIMIEVKTLSESVLRNLELYDKFCQYLRSHLWSCDFYYLLSHGHEKQKDWSALSKKRSNIIVWEDLFRVMSKSSISDLIGDSLHEYCDPPVKRC